MPMFRPTYPMWKLRQGCKHDPERRIAWTATEMAALSGVSRDTAKGTVSRLCLLGAMEIASRGRPMRFRWVAADPDLDIVTRALLEIIDACTETDFTGEEPADFITAIQ